jgi:hypothetical protein
MQADLHVSSPVLVITAVKVEGIYLCTVSIKTETGCNIDQALTLAVPRCRPYFLLIQPADELTACGFRESSQSYT